MIDLTTLVEGEIDQIDYDKQQRITVIRAEGRDGGRYEISFTYPAVLPDLKPDQEHYVIMRQSLRPVVSVVRLA